MKNSGELKGKIPVPMIENFDLGFIKEFYKETIQLLTQDQRKLIRDIPSKINQIFEASGEFNSQVLEQSLYNPRTARNVLWLASVTLVEIERLQDQNSKYEAFKGPNSIDATKKVILELGFTEQQIEEANALQSMLTDEQIKEFNSYSSHQVPA